MCMRSVTWCAPWSPARLRWRPSPWPSTGSSADYGPARSTSTTPQPGNETRASQTHVNLSHPWFLNDRLYIIYGNSPALLEKIGELVRERGASMVDAPVMGDRASIENGVRVLVLERYRQQAVARHSPVPVQGSYLFAASYHRL